MRKVIFIAICAVGVLGLTSCRSTAPCGLSQQTKQKQIEYNQTDVIVADATVITE